MKNTLKPKSRTWPAHFTHRLKSLRHRLRTQKLDALLINHPPDTRYLCGFTGEDSWSLVTPRQLIVLSDSRFEEELRRDHNYAHIVMRKGQLVDALADVLKRTPATRLGIQAEHISMDERRRLAKAVGAKKLVETSGWLVTQRSIKDSVELKSARKAIRFQEAAYRQTLKQIKIGMTEREVAALLEFNMRSLGADGCSFPTIIASGPNASRPHHVPGGSRIRKNVPVLIDFGAKADGYCGDLTRVICIGRMPRRIAEIYQIVREAQRRAIQAIAPGKSLQEIDAVARGIITQAGYGKQFGHGLGHGIGLEIHEHPSLGPRSSGSLTPGQIVTVEPGIYLPGVGGVRIEDDILVTARGHQVLSSLPTDLESAMI